MTGTPDRGRTVAWIILGDEGYGVRRMIASLTGELNRRGWSTPVVSLNDGPSAEECSKRGLHTVVLNTGPLPALRGHLARRALSLARLRRVQFRVTSRLVAELRTLTPDAVHVVLPVLVGLAGSAARAIGVPSFFEMPRHVSDTLPLQLNRRLMQRQCRRNGTVPLAISDFVASTFGHGPAKPVVVHLGADPGRFDPTLVDPVPREALGIPRDAVVLLICARLTEDKGQRRVLQAMLLPEFVEAPLHLLLLGGPVDGDYARRLRHIAETAGAGHRLHLTGLVADPERYYGAADIAVNCRIEPEAFGLSVVEAMMMERPVLVRALGGPAETVTDGQTGWHISDPSVATLASGIRRVLDDRSRWQEMGRAARCRALAHFTTARQAEQYIAIVERYLAEF